MGTPEPQSIRIGTAEREQAVKALGDHFADGRLEPHEFEERVSAAYAARTAPELDRLFDDLPHPGGPPHGTPTHGFPLYSGPLHVGPQPSGPLPLATGRHAAPDTGPEPPAGATRGYLPATGPIGRSPLPRAAFDVHAPYGREPLTGVPYSDRSKVIAGLLQLFFPMGIGRLYSGHIGVGVAQLLLTPFVVGVIWAFIDGIVILAGRPTDPHGRPLRP